MEAALFYWLKANVVLALFGAAYYGLLRRLTFFGLNRAYLLFAVAFAVVYPLLPMPALLPASAGALLPLPTAHLPLAAPGAAAPDPPLDYARYLLLGGFGLYLAGAAALLLRLLGQLLSLAQVRRQSRQAVVLGQAVRVVPGAGGPFSFGGTIYLTKSTLTDAAALPATLRHEQAHVRQRHTLDVLLLHLATALAWPNPAAWLLRRAALDNLEYLADRAALQAGTLPRRDYQYLLLRQQAGDVPAPALAFHFSFLTLKNRIHMLNQPLSTSRQLGRYLLTAPLVVLLALGYSAAHAQVVPKPAPAVPPAPQNTAYYIDSKPSTYAEVGEIKPDDILSIDIVKSAPDKRKLGLTNEDGAALITTKANATSPAVVAFNKRFPVVPATAEQNAATAAATAYVTQHYPAAKLESVGPVQGKTNRYRAFFTNDGKRVYLLFDGNGQVVEQ